MPSEGMLWWGVAVAMLVSFFSLGASIEQAPVLSYGNVSYGEMWNYTGAGYSFAFPDDDIYYNLTGLVAGDLRNFSFTNAAQALGGSYLTAHVGGVYSVNAHMTAQGSVAGGEYGFGIAKNFIMQRDCYVQMTGSTAHDPRAISCILVLQAGDTVNLQMDDEAFPTKAIVIHTVNLNVVRLERVSGII